jgi:hypothetical protein
MNPSLQVILFGGQPTSASGGDSGGVTGDIFVVAGQSNATGHYTTLVGVPTYVVADPGVQLWDYDNSEFVEYQAGVNSIQPASGNNAPTPDCWGPEAVFSYRLRQANPSKTVYLVKYAIGSTQLYDDGSGITWNAGVTGTTRSLFERTENAITAAKAITALGLTPKVRGIIFMQGEQDALAGSQGGPEDAAYPTNLTALLTAMRSRWGDADTRIVLGRINPAWGGVGTQTRLAEEVQMDADALGAWINTDTYHLTSSHFDNTSQPMFGSDCYDAYLGNKYIDFVVNGSFTTDTSGWHGQSSPNSGTSFVADPSVIAWSAAGVVITSGVNKEIPGALQTIAGLVVGKQYWFQGKLVSASQNGFLRVADDTQGMGNNFGIGTTTFAGGNLSTPGTFEGSFVATQSSVTIGLFNWTFNTSGSNTFDNVRLIGPNWTVPGDLSH